MTTQTTCHSEAEQELNYASKVLLMMREMEPDEVRQLDVNSTNYTRFISTCKALIDAKFTQQWGFEIEFNPDYTKMKKLTKN